MAALEHIHEFHILEPNYCRLKHKMKSALAAKLESLQNVMALYLSSQQQQEKMMSEAKLLKIMIYKRNLQLRREKSLQLLKRVQACLKRASTFGRLFTLIDDIQKDLQSAVTENKESETVYLPAQQTWSYFLYLQLQYVKLLDTNASYCITAFKHLSCHLATGMLIPQMIVFMGIVARIWLLSRCITEKIQSCYSHIYSLRQHIDRTNSDWNDPVLPSQLQLSKYQETITDLKAVSHTACTAPLTESIEANQSDHMVKQIVTQRTAFSLIDQQMEDIGVPIVMKRKVSPGPCDDAISSKRQKETGASDLKRKIIKSSTTKHDTFAVVSGVAHTDYTGMPTKKMKRKCKMEHTANNEMQLKKEDSAVLVKSAAQSLQATDSHDIEDSVILNVVDHKGRSKKKKEAITDMLLFNMPSITECDLQVQAANEHQKTKQNDKKKVHRVDESPTKKSYRKKSKKSKAKHKKKKHFQAT